MFKKILAGELGNKLPAGLRGGAGVQRDFTIRRFTGGIDTEINEWAQANSQKTQGEFVTHIIAVALESLCGMSFDTASMPEREAMIGSLYFTDPMYIYFRIRIASMKSKLVRDISCTRCGKEYDGVEFDLDKTDVRYAEDDAVFRQTVELGDGLQYGEKFLKSVELETPRWSLFKGENFDAKSLAGLRRALVTSSVIGSPEIPGTRLMVTPGIYAEMLLDDIDLIIEEVSEISPGAELSLEFTCPKCNMTTATPLDWGYAAFFTRSSARSRQTKRA